nr:vegetative cell wall protein gp1-like [Aegilops tauschii subsp. strangulata]
MAAASPATLVFLLSLICAPSRFLTGALPPPPPTPPKPVIPYPTTPPKPVMPAPTTPPKPVMPAPTTPPKPVMPAPTTPPKPVMPAPTMPPKPVMPAPTTPPKPVMPVPTTPPKPVTPPPVTPPKYAPKPVLPPPATPTKPVLPPPVTAPKPVTPPIAMPPTTALAPAPWDEPGYGSNPIPEEIKSVCRRRPFPQLCARALAFVVDPQRVNDTRWLAETSLRIAIEAGTGLAAFGWVNLGGAPSGTRLRMCVRDCTVRVDAAVKNLTASQVALRRGELREAVQTLGEAAKGCGMCWGSCASFTGEVMQVMVKRAKDFQKLVMVASSVILIIIK